MRLEDFSEEDLSEVFWLKKEFEAQQRLLGVWPLFGGAGNNAGGSPLFLRVPPA